MSRQRKAETKGETSAAAVGGSPRRREKRFGTRCPPDSGNSQRKTGRDSPREPGESEGKAQKTTNTSPANLSLFGRELFSLLAEGKGLLYFGETDGRILAPIKGPRQFYEEPEGEFKEKGQI